MIARQRDPGGRLVAAILAHGAAAGCTPVLLTRDQHDWASATFAGLRQRLLIAASPGRPRADWLTQLPDADFAILGHYLADLTVAAMEDADHVAIETLLLTEA